MKLELVNAQVVKLVQVQHETMGIDRTWIGSGEDHQGKTYFLERTDRHADIHMNFPVPGIAAKVELNKTRVDKYQRIRPPRIRPATGLRGGRFCRGRVLQCG